MAVRNTPPSAVMGSAGVMIDGRGAPLAGEGSDGELENDWCFVSLYGTVENEENWGEEREEQEDVRQVTHSVANCISKELLYNQEDELQAETVDEIFRNFEEVAEADPRPMVTFLSAWRQQENRRRISADGSHSSADNKSIIIALMVDLLRVSPEPVKIHLLWLKILTHFILLSNSLQVLLDLKVAPTILGTMSAYRRSAEIQQYGCTALSIFATIRPTPESKAPLRESAIQVLTESLSNHADNIDVVQAACQLIATVAEVMVHIPSWCLDQEFTAEETELLCQSADNILQCIKDGVVDRLGEISRRYSMTQEIKASITKLMACFGCYSLEKRYPADEVGFRPKAFSFPIPGKEKHVHFSQTLEVIALENGEYIPAFRCSSLDISEATQEEKSKMKVTMRKGESIELDEENIPSHHEERQRGDQTQSGSFDEEQSPNDKGMDHTEDQEDGEERQEQQFHHPHEECRHPTNTYHLTDKEKACLIEDAWKFLETENNKDEIWSSKGLELERGKGYPDGINFSEIEESKEDLVVKEERSDCENYWDCLFTSLKAKDETEGDIRTDIEECTVEQELEHYCSHQDWISSSEGTECKEGTGGGEQSHILSNEIDESRTIADVVDEMSDGVYSYDVQPDSEKYAVYSEFDIMEALVKAGLLNEQEKQPGIPKFPVDDSFLEDGENDQSLDSSDRYSEAPQRLQSAGDFAVTEECYINSTEHSNGSEKWNRVPSHYDNVPDEESDNEQQVCSDQDHRQLPPADFRQRSFDSGLDDAEERMLSPSRGDANSSDYKGNNNNTCEMEESQEMAEWGAYRRREQDKQYIDECYRMSRLSIMLDDIQGLTWHENAAFKLASMVTPQCVVEEEKQAIADGRDTDDTADRSSSIHEDRGRSDSHSSSQSCSSGSYCIQPHNRLMECRSMGSLEHLCSPRETHSACELDMMKRRKRPDVLKTMSCSNVDMVVPPPKPRRTWYYQSSWDVRRSLVRSFGPNYEGFDNPIYDEPPMDLYATVSKPNKKDQENEPTYAKVQKKHLSPASSETSNGVHKSGTASSNDSGVVLLANKTYKSRIYSHLYEDITSLNIKANEKSDTLSRYLEEDSSEATYEVCTLWVNGRCTEALDTFNHLTQRLASLYSIVPEARKEESRRSALLYDLEDLGDDYPAWANILNVLASYEEKWTLRLTAKVLPIVDRLFQVKDKNVLNAVIELVQVLIKRYGKDMIKNRHPSLFKTRFREDCRECFTWLSKLKLRTEFLLMKKREAQDPDWDCLLHSSLLNSFSDSLLPFSKSR